MGRYLLKYQPRTADILLWRPKYVREYLICGASGSPFHHASLIRVSKNKQVVVVEQNIDFVPEGLRDLSEILKIYDLDVMRAEWLTRLQRFLIVSAFQKMKVASYSYFGALMTWLYARGFVSRSGREYDYIFHNKLDPCTLMRVAKDNRVKYKILNRYTCSGLVCLAYSRVTKVNLCPNVPPNYTSPFDIFQSPALRHLGLIGPKTTVIL